MLFRTILRPVVRRESAGRVSPRLFRTIPEFQKRFPEIERVNYDQLIQSQADVDCVTPDAISTLDVKDIVNLIFHTARKNCRMSQDQLNGVALTLSRKTVDDFDAQSVSNVMYGLHPYNSTMKIDTLLIAIMHKVALSDEELRAQHIGNSLYGLQGMDSSNLAVRKLILALAERIDTCTEEMNALEFGNTMYGLRNMSSMHEEVRHLLHILTTKLESCEEPLSCQVMSISLIGLGSMSSRHPEVLNILRVLSEKIKRTECSMDSVAVSGIYGLNKMYSDKAEVRQLVQVLSDKLHQSTEENFEPWQLASALYGLQLMSARPEEVRNLVSVLASKIERNCIEMFSPQTLDLALRGIRAMSSEYQEVRHLIRALANKINVNSKFATNYFVSISSSLSMKSCEFIEVRELYQAYTDAILLNSQRFTVNDINQIFSNLSHLQSARPEVANLMKALDTKLIDAIPNSVHIHPIMLALQHMPQEETWVQDMIEHVTIQVKAAAADRKNALIPRDVLQALSFMATYDCDSAYVRCLTLSLLNIFDNFDSEAKEDIFLGAQIRMDVLGGLVGVGQQDEFFLSAYLKLVDVILVSTYNSIELTDIIYRFHSITYVDGTESGVYLSKICSSLLKELSRVEGDKLNIRQIAGALYGLQGLLFIPPAAGEPLGPGAVMCIHYVKTLKKMLTDDDTEINIFSCQLNANLTLQHMVLFEFACQTQLEELGLAKDVSLIVSKLKDKLNTRSHKRKLFRSISAHCTLTVEEEALLVSNEMHSTDQDIDLFRQHCFEVCFPALYVLQVRNSRRKAKHHCFDPNDNESFNMEMPTWQGSPSEPHIRHLNKLRDELLKSRYNTTTIRCTTLPGIGGGNGGNNASQRARMLEVLQDATLELVFPASK